MNEPILGVIFDLDGVIVSTDDCHYLAWKRMADEEGIPFDRKVNERLRGVSRMASLEIILEKATKTYTEEQKVEMATRKNGYYVELIQQLTADAMLPGAMATLEMLKKRGVKIAIGSSSRNTPIILRQIGLDGYFDAVADGNQITHSKPDPEVFLLGAKLLGLDYPGGPLLSKMAAQGTAGRFVFPRPMTDRPGLDFSFSGLKTAAVNLIHNAQQKGQEINVPDLCASFSAAVSEMLIPRAMQALELTGRKTLAVAGGVAANSRIRADLTRETQKRGVRLCMPPLSLCGDNAAMIGAQGYYEYLSGNLADQTLNAYATKSMEGETL